MAEDVLDVAHYQAQVYPDPVCWSLVTQVYADLRGGPPNEVQTMSETMRLAARAFRLALHKGPGGLQQLAEPRDFAIVLMWTTPRQRDTHCGIYYAGSVLHALSTGVLYQDLASLRAAYPIMEFWGHE